VRQDSLHARRPNEQKRMAEPSKALEETGSEGGKARVDASAQACPDGKPRKKRAYFVDIWRLVVSVQMVNGHTLDELMLPSLKQGAFFENYTKFRGLVSVSFLLMAGFAFHLATLARFEAHRASPTAIRKRFQRGFVLILVGYGLRYSSFAITGTSPAAERAFEYLLRCNILQCIGVTLITLEAMTVLARRPRQVALAAGTLAATVFALAPYADRVIPEGRWHFAISYISHQSGSMFPLLPWAGYMLAGTALAFFTMPQGAATPFRVTMTRLASAAAVAFVVARLLESGLVPRAPAGHHPAADTPYVVMKLAYVLIIISTIYAVSHKLARFPRLFAIISAETLAVYVIHLVILYKWPLFVVNRIGRGTFTLPQALLTSAIMVVSTISLTVLYHWVKDKRRRVPELLRNLKWGRGGRGQIAN